MRTLLSSLVTSGGMLAVVAFFLPWVAISCNGDTYASISPHDRAAGIEVESDVALGDSVVSFGGGTQSLPPEPGYWLLLGVAGGLALAGLTMTALKIVPLRRLGGAASFLAFVGLFATVGLGLGERLGISWPETSAPGVNLQIVFEPGVWISVVGYALALAGAVSAMVLGPSADL